MSSVKASRYPMLTTCFVCKRVILLFVLLSTLMQYRCSSTTSSDQTKPSDSSRVAPLQPIKPKLYLEHSGSMFGYDGLTIHSNCRDAVFKLISTLPKPDSIFIVNDIVSIHPLPFVNLNTSSNLFKSEIGNIGYTDFRKIFTNIAKNVGKNELSILTTDLIHSNVGGDGLDSNRIRSNALNLARSAMGDYAKDIALLVIQLESEFDGLYYTFNHPSNGIHYQGNRPVYLLLFARNATMDRLLSEAAYANLRNFSDLGYPGFRNVLLFSNSTAGQNPFYTLEENAQEAKGSFEVDQDDNRNSKGIHTIKNLKAPDQDNQKLTLCVDVGLPSTYGSQELLNTANYEVESLEDGFKLKAVKIVKGRKDKATHRLLLEASHLGGNNPRTVTIRLKRNFPPVGERYRYQRRHPAGCRN